MTRIRINVSGVVFEFEMKMLEEFPEHTLYKLCYKAAQTKDSGFELTVDRPSDCFAAVLAFYQIGELHMPNNVCPNAFKTEMAYWGISDMMLHRCCYYR